MKKKLVTFMLGMMMCAPLVFSSGISASAQTLVDSTASSAEDENAGKDVTQGVHTEYVTPDAIETTTYEGTETTKIYATKTGNVVITVPKILVIGEGEEAGTYGGTFNVKVRGDIAGSQNVNIKPIIESTLTEVGGKNSNTETTVTLDGKENCDIDANDLLNGNEVVLKGELGVTGLTSGVWQGDLSFNVSLTNDK